MSVPRIIGYTTEDVKQNYKNQSKSIEECTDCTHFSRIPTQCVSPVKTLGIHIAWKSGFGANYFSHDGLIVVHYFSIKYFEWVIFKQAAIPFLIISRNPAPARRPRGWVRVPPKYRNALWGVRLKGKYGGRCAGFRWFLIKNNCLLPENSEKLSSSYSWIVGEKVLFFSCSNFSSNWPLPLFKTDLFWKF